MSPTNHETPNPSPPAGAPYVRLNFPKKPTGQQVVDWVREVMAEHQASQAGNQTADQSQPAQAAE